MTPTKESGKRRYDELVGFGFTHTQAVCKVLEEEGDALREAVKEARRFLDGMFHPYGHTAANRERYPRGPEAKRLADKLDATLERHP